MVLATVRHTGSHFALHLFEQCPECGRGGPFVRHDSLYEPPTGNDLWFSHVEGEKMGRIQDKVAESPPLICTMRHPIKVAQSWVKRRLTLGHEFKSMWQNLFNLYDSTVDSFWLPVDHSERDRFLGYISSRLGVELKTDWVPRGTTEDNWPWAMSFDETRAFLKTLPFWQFGYDLDIDIEEAA